MWLIEPPTPVQEAPIYYIAVKASVSKSQKRERILGICERVEPGFDSMGFINIGDANLYMERYENKPNFFGNGSAAIVTIVRQPAYGKLKVWAFGKMENGLYSTTRAIPAVPLDSSNKVFNAEGLFIQYTPEADYLGDDSYVVQFEQDGVKVKVKQFFVVDPLKGSLYGGCEIAPGKYKKDLDTWKISQSAPSASDLPAWQPSVGLSDL